MICEKHPPPASHATDPEALALVAVATGLADGIKTLVPECTVGVVAGIHSEWQLLAQRGPIDIATTWRPSLANRVRASDRARQTADYLVAPFSSVSLHVLLVLIAAPGQRLPARVRPAMQSLLDDGGVLLDRALAAQAHDRLIRRVVLLCQQRNGAPQRGIADVEKALSALWPNATARFYDAGAFDEAPSTPRRLMGAACAGDQPVVGRTPAHHGLLPPDLTFHVAIPIRRHGGALLITAYAGGEEPDAISVATAMELVGSLESFDTDTRPSAAILTGAATHV